MARTVRIPTTFTPLEAAHLRRLARQYHQAPAGFLHMIAMEQIRELIRQEQGKEKSSTVRPSSGGSTDVLAETRQPA